MDRWTLNMTAGAVLSALLVMVGTNTFVNILYPTGGSPEAPAQVADASSGDSASGSGEAQTAAGALSFASLLSAASVESGANQARKCVACHSFDAGGANKIGPNLHDIVGREVASHEGFAYSNALKEYAGVWDYERLSCFIENPRTCVPGNKMSFAGVKNDKERAEIIAYLRSISPNAPPLPEAGDAAATQSGAAGDTQNDNQKATEASASPGATASEPAQTQN